VVMQMSITRTSNCFIVGPGENRVCHVIVSGTAPPAKYFDGSLIVAPALLVSA